MTDIKFHYPSFEASSMAFKASLDILSISPVGCSPPLSSVVFERMFVSCSTSASSITTVFSEARSFSSCAVRSHAGRWLRQLDEPGLSELGILSFPGRIRGSRLSDTPTCFSLSLLFFWRPRRDLNPCSCARCPRNFSDHFSEKPTICPSGQLLFSPP
jgi:hypothetical protein